MRVGIDTVKYQISQIYSMFFLSTTYHLFQITLSEQIQVEDVFIFTNKQDAQDLSELLKPKDTILAGVMDVENEHKLVWICDHTLDEEEVTLSEMLELIQDSIKTFTEEFRDKWI